MLFEVPAQEIPIFVPAKVRPLLAGASFSVALPAGVRARMRTPQRVGVADHVLKNKRVVPDGPHSGRWRHELAPQSVKIMNTFSLSYVREINFCGVEQAAKTATMLNCLHWAVDIDPANIFYAMPTEETSKKILEEKLIPMIRQSPATKRYVSKRQDDISLKRISLSNGVTIHPAHANSPSSMASFPAKFIFGDEVDKFPTKSGKEASPIVLLKKRTRLYAGRWKCFFSSTPAQGYIYDAAMGCAQVWQWQNRCPHCLEHIRFAGKNLILPEGLPPKEFDSSTVIGVVCPACGVELNRSEYALSIAGAAWVCIKGEGLQRPATVGFHMPAWGCADIPLEEIATAWGEHEQSKSYEAGVAWANGYEAANYVHEQKDREEDFILRLVDESAPRSVVPADTQTLLITADTQQIGFFYQVWAIGWGQDLTLSMIEHGRLDTFEGLVDKQHKEFFDGEGKKFIPRAGFIDSGGGTNPARPKHTRTVEVYRFCRENKFWRALKGQRNMESSWNVKRRDYYPKSVGKKVPIPGGLNLYTLNVTFYKNELDHKLHKESGDAGAITFHADTDKDFARQLCAEYQDESGHWICPKGKDNHHWDCVVYLLALCDIMGLRDKRRAVKRTGPAKKRRGGGSFATSY